MQRTPKEWIESVIFWVLAIFLAFVVINALISAGVFSS